MVAAATPCAAGAPRVPSSGVTGAARRVSVLPAGIVETNPALAVVPTFGLLVVRSPEGSSGTCSKGTGLRCLWSSARNSCAARCRSRWCPNFKLRSGRSSSVSVTRTVPLMAWQRSSSARSVGSGEINEIQEATSSSSHSSTGFAARWHRRTMADWLMIDRPGVMFREEPTDEGSVSFTDPAIPELASLLSEEVDAGTEATGSSTIEFDWFVPTSRYVMGGVVNGVTLELGT
mmetsp:Transcript_25480/g.73130  ORF Transcript_25480/g.73130 Transcript_25480/m.73130 type:complete len:232 (+) Transcript_25480:817-1512(+)